MPLNFFQMCQICPTFVTMCNYVQITHCPKWDAKVKSANEGDMLLMTVPEGDCCVLWTVSKCP